MRDEQEKCFALQKGPLNQNRLRTWSEESRHGRMFICFVGLILSSYVRHIWEENEYLCKIFDFPIPDCCVPVYVSKASRPRIAAAAPPSPRSRNSLFSTEN